MDTFLHQHSDCHYVTNQRVIVSIGTGDLVPTYTEIVPAGLESVNGSDPTMGCTEPITSNGMVSCMSEDTGFLTDGNVPVVNMSTSNWAAELVTIRRVGYNEQITFDHALMTFEFGEHVAITTIYLDLLYCPYSGIEAPHISVYGSDSLTFRFNSYENEVNADFLVTYIPSHTSCKCRMVTVVLRIQQGEVPHSVYHILVYFAHYEQWMHVGEVRFSDAPVPRQSSRGDVFCDSHRPLPG